MLLNKNNNHSIHFKSHFNKNNNNIAFGLSQADKTLRDHISSNIYMGSVNLDSIYSITNLCDSLEGKLARNYDSSDITDKVRASLLLNLRIILTQISNLLNPSKIGVYREAIINHYKDIEAKNKNYATPIIETLRSGNIDKATIPEMFLLHMPKEPEKDTNTQITNIKDILPEVAGNPHIKEVIFDEIIDPIKNFDPRYDKKPDGIFLYGPTGSGKTFIASQIAKELGWQVMEVSLGNIGSSYMHKTSTNLTEKFEEAKRKGKVVLLMNEFDSIGKDRNDIDKGESHKRDEVNTLLQCLDGCADKNVLVIATSNHKQKIDNAVLRPGRFKLALEVGYPDLESRIDIFRNELLKTPVGYDLANNPEDLKKVATMYDQVSSATIVHAIIPGAKRLAKFKQDNLNLNYFIQAKDKESVKSALNNDRKALKTYEANNTEEGTAYSGTFPNFGFVP